jgi:hypothetical protein
MGKFFQSCKTKQEAKKMFRELAKIHHPDTATGDNDTMVAIIAEYEKVVKILPSITDDGFSNQTEEEFILHVSKEMKDILDNISHLPIDIEIIGTWIWVSGNTYPYKSYLTAYNFTWCANKKMYQWHLEKDSHAWRGKVKPIEDIRNAYGTTKIKNSERQSIA